MSRSKCLRDRIADLPEFSQRDRQLPMIPEARATPSTFAMLPKHDRAKEFADRGLPTFFAAITHPGDLIAIYDHSIPEGFFEIDGVRISLPDLISKIEETP